MGEVDHPVKSLLIRTDKKASTYLKYIGDTSVVLDSFSRRFELNEVISTKNEFKIIKNYIMIHNTQKKRTCVDNGFNTQLITLLDKCDTLYYLEYVFLVKKVVQNLYISLIFAILAGN